MTEEACREACFHAAKKERAARVHAATLAVCGCEVHSVSQYSPSKVSDDELLHLVISDPKSLLNGSLNPASLIQLDTGGLSILRDAATDEEFSITIGQLKERAVQQGAEWFFFGVCSFTARVVRYDNDNRFLCVYDTGLLDKPHHADIMGPDLRAMTDPMISRSEQDRRNKARIKRTIDKIGPVFTSAARFRSGKFLEYARQTSG